MCFYTILRLFLDFQSCIEILLSAHIELNLIHKNFLTEITLSSRGDVKNSLENDLYETPPIGRWYKNTRR